MVPVTTMSPSSCVARRKVLSCCKRFRNWLVTASVNRGSSSNTTNQSGVGSRVSHTAELEFRVKPIETTQLQADLQAMLNRSSTLKNPNAVTVVLEGPVAILRGKVADEDEKRLVEGMMRLTPGIRGVRNELLVP